MKPNILCEIIHEGCISISTFPRREWGKNPICPSVRVERVPWNAVNESSNYVFLYTYFEPFLSAYTIKPSYSQLSVLKHESNDYLEFI